jgi:hypothetical protein
VGGIGSCGRELCCATWLTDFKSVNTAAARYQNLSINQTKLSGQCGRLKCCLNYELDTYLDALEGFPENADMLQVKRGTATLIKKDIFKNLMWYVLPDSSKQYPLTIERVKKIRSQNNQNIIPEELEAVEVTSSKPKEVEPEFVDVVGQISLKTLEKAEKKKKQQQRPQQTSQRQLGGQQRGPQQGPRNMQPPQKGQQQRPNINPNAQQQKPGAGQPPKPTGQGGQGQGPRPPRQEGRPNNPQGQQRRPQQQPQRRPPGDGNKGNNSEPKKD